MDKLAIAREVLSGIAMTSDEARTLDAILDRLSPPAPEVDEATRIWREMNAEGARACGSIPLMVQKWRNGEHDNDVSAIAEITYLRQAIAELIASKDGEIERVNAENFRLAAGVCIYPNGEGLLGDDHGNSFCSVEQERKRLDERETELMADLNKAESDLAALRAENERLKTERDSELAAVSAAIGTTEFMDPPDGGSPTLAEQVGRMRAELAALRAENERLKATLNTLGTRWALRKAAERNTAEPEHRLSDESNRKAGEVVRSTDSCSSDGSGNTAKPATEMTPDVVVTQADCQREQWARNIASYTEGRARNHVYECAINLLTEAEARGRREALEEVRKAVWDRLYPKNPESDWTPYARDMANAAKAAADEIGHLRQQGQTDAED